MVGIIINKNKLECFFFKKVGMHYFPPQLVLRDYGK